MGKWADRAADNARVGREEGTDKTDRRGLLAVVSVREGDGVREIGPATRVRGPEAPDAKGLDQIAWSNADIDRFIARSALFRRRGWSEHDAVHLAERLARRDREGDRRVCCAECGNYRAGQCGNHRRAGLQSRAVAAEFAAMLQWCSGAA